MPDQWSSVKCELTTLDRHSHKLQVSSATLQGLSSGTFIECWVSPNELVTRVPFVYGPIWTKGIIFTGHFYNLYEIPYWFHFYWLKVFHSYCSNLMSMFILLLENAFNWSNIFDKTVIIGNYSFCPFVWGGIFHISD